MPSAKRLLSLLVLLILGCRRKTEPLWIDPPPPELPPLPVLRLAFEDRLDADPPPAAEPAAAALRWDFSPGAKYVYRIDQSMANLSTARDPFGTQRLRSTLRGEGIFEIQAGRERTAKAWYKLSLKEWLQNDQPQDINKQPPAKIEWTLREDGSVAESKSHSGGEAEGLEFLFELPRGELRPGSRTERPHRSVGTYRITGTVATTLTGYARVERWTCARLVTEFSLVMGPPLDDGNGAGSMIGKIVAYFGDGRFVRVDGAISFVWHTRQHYRNPGERPRWNVGTLESHTLLQARFQ
jgi:hypothetical protein